MKVESVKLLSFISRMDYQFEIPLFQRNYCWKMQQIEQLNEDLIDISDKPYDHFFGSFLLYLKNDNLFEIIDGQQRFMSLSLLIKALSTYKTINQTINNLQAKLKNMIISLDGKVKLKPQSVDEEEFNNIILNSDPKGNTSYLATAYFGFKERIINDEMFNKILSGLEKLMVSIIIVDDGDQNKQTIFEKMNSLGIDLSLFDMCRNQIFFKVPTSDDLEKLYSDYWIFVEKNLTNIPKDEFISIYIDSLSQLELGDDKRKYSSFKKVVDDELIKRGTLRHLFIDLKRCSRIYANIKGTSSDYQHQIETYLKQFRILNYTSVYPFLLRVIRTYENLQTKSTSIETVLFTILTYLVRMLSIDNKTFNFNKSNYMIFQLLNNQQLLEFDPKAQNETRNRNEELVGFGGQVVRYIYRYLGIPSDTTVQENINKGIFKTGSKGRFYLSIGSFDLDKINFENLKKVKFVDDNKNYEDRIGNLMFSDLSEVDQYIQNYQDRVIALSTMVSGRESYLVGNILDNYPIKYNLPKKPQRITVNINSSMDFSRVKLDYYKIQRMNPSGTKYADLYRDIIIYCFKRNPMQFVEWADIDKNFTESGKTPHISYSDENMKGSMVLTYKNKTIYCNTNLSTNQIIYNAREMLDQNIKYVSLTITL
ncbi:DUF262 domain-containing protein [Acholeplasma manati]|uniref:DUF262 domain-containing protein n=1 Tax=Paracholeplasma manati TaxID=591373 RepID=A0ABT2Y5F8_9MOLU|nr:DUF262 domain-containing protein [Paracholeplasma manati]MCV2231225.1 DUF262 domain-containing protein [Paracholeplasma manati]